MKASAKVSLTERDIAVVSFVYLYDGVVAEQIRRRFWNTIGGRSPCYQRLSRLIQAGYLVAHRLPSRTGMGSGSWFITIGPKAYQLLIDTLEVDRSELRRINHQVTAPFVAHHVAIGNARRAIEAGCEQFPLVTLQEWESERELRQNPIRIDDPRPSPGSSKTITIIPDGAFTLELEGKTQAYYLEVDMGTLAPKRAHAKLRAYLLHAWELRIPVLWVVPGARRQQQIARWASEQAEALSKSPRIFWITTLTQVDEQTVLFSPIWQKAGTDQPVCLIPRPVQAVPTPMTASAFASHHIFAEA